ncbi:MFS transporter [Saccharothrix violaceirubra]|uniref:Putative MFS family arabinose efflux permease n=1 Tax=Saccharothrix violaceirubra TaxID=413306 RepID=A0A7W7T260_9PSEU|nr:MFS transporter [Saccharothrix violaceirubra]MBB4965212.1 putative MFS family arabinose efflux permease [Saccharothrix violaceirubra]
MKRTPYWPVLTHPVLRKVLPGIGVSSIGDGMSTIAIAWLALLLAPADQKGLWVALAAAAYVLPGAIGAVAFERWLRGRSGAQLAGWDAVLRAVVLGAIAVVHFVGLLTPMVFVVLLAVSSLLAAWGKAGRYTLLAELLPEEHVLAGNAVVNVLLEFSTVGGPPLAALLIAWAGPAAVIALDAATFAVLALTYRAAVPPSARETRIKAPASRSTGLRTILSNPELVGLMVLSFGFFLFFGPVTVALPVHVSEDLHGTAVQLAGYYTAFGIGAVLGAIVAGYLKNWPMRVTTVGIVLGFGLALLPLGLSPSTVVGWIAFGLCGLIWGPFPSTTTVLFQRAVPADGLAPVLAARGAVMSLAGPAGALVGAPAVVLLTAQGTLAAAAVGMIVLAGLTAAFFLASHRKRVVDVVG